MTETSFIPGPETTRAFREALGCFATGVTVVTTQVGGKPRAITVNSFSSVSLTPPLVLWCLDHKSNRYDVFAGAQNYAIHVMGEEQQRLALDFARDGDDFSHARWQANADGVPLLDDCLARFECRLSATHEAGDHIIILGEVTRAMHRPGHGLIFKRGQYGAFSGLL
ncbi:flavin reductase family protein [Lutimaribacter marinistellae]|uniref:Flavin reductase family protein n=1 Tax=Lutimaribacter marinistellae TaxID=1820329 RepID=A0ABV7TQZ8_9RHOB